MSNVYAGVAELVKHLESHVVTGATNASPIVVQTADPHDLFTGYQVLIVGVNGNTAAQNSPGTPWTVTVVDSTHFSLDGSTGNGAFTSSPGARVFACNLTPAGTIPGDGDLLDVASVNVMLELLADRTAFLMRAIGVRGYVPGTTGPSSGILINTYQVESGIGSGWAAWSTGTPGSSGWGKVASWPSPLYNLAPPPLANHGDFFKASFTAGQATSATNRARLALGAVFLNADMGAGASAANQIGAAAMVAAGATHPLALQGECNLNMQGIAASISAFSAGVMTVSGLTNMASSGVGTLVVSGCATAGNNGRFPIIAVSGGNSATVKAPGGSATDANNGAIRWHIEDTQFDFDLEVLGVGGSQPTYTLTGDYSLIVHHYRPPAILQF